jgi:hypothetical protein
MQTAMYGQSDEQSLDAHAAAMTALAASHTYADPKESRLVRSESGSRQITFRRLKVNLRSKT